MTKSKLSGSNDQERLQDLSTLTYQEQGIWWLNAYWENHQDQAENLWSFVKKFEKLDLDKKNEGTGLDEMNAHRFLESINETKTVKELRDSLRDTGALGPNERPKLVPLVHYLLYRYRGTTDWHELVNAPQGSNEKELREAQRLMEEVNRAFEDAAAKADAANRALREAESREAEAKRSEADAKAREADAKKSESDAIARENDAKRAESDAIAREADAQRAQVELEAALAELKAQEDAFNSRTDSLRSKSEDESVSVVGRNKAKNELAQHLSSDPLPLRKAKITQEAAVKKAEKATTAAVGARQQAVSARQAAESARAAAVTARQQAESARHEAEAARQQAERAREAAAAAKAASDEALDEARRKVAEAEAFLEEVKKRPGQAYGALWWLQRGLEEAKNFLPERKGGFKKVDTTR
jgi:hypothetical protein